MNAVYSLLRAECGIDFSHYEPNTVLRRIDRRLQLNRAVDLEDYIAHLRSDRQELNSLYRDLLIGVTKFFRDPELFKRLQQDVIREVLVKVPADDEIRIWVAGCATGEEAYSLAMLFHESLVLADRPVNVKILATDVHRASLKLASAGLYDEAALSEVSASAGAILYQAHRRVQDFAGLTKDDRFCAHNVIKDAPFTKLDLISCRNLQIYLRAHAQKKTLSLFHFGLKTAGVLVLGPSESLGELADEFETLDNHWKIFRKRRDIRLPVDMRLSSSPSMPQKQVAGSSLRSSRPAFPDSSLVKVYDEILNSYVPPSLLVNMHHELIHSFAGAGRFLRMPDGRPPSDILDMVESDLAQQFQEPYGGPCRKAFQSPTAGSSAARDLTRNV